MVLPLSMHRHLCSPGVFAIVEILLLPLLQWHCCHHQAGVLPSLQWPCCHRQCARHLCHCHDGFIALIALVPLSTLCGCCCPCCTCIVVLIVLTSLPSHRMGTIVAPALLPPLSWHVCAIALVLLPLSRWCCHPWCTGISTLVAQASLP
jgi:hypothetical protein